MTSPDRPTWIPYDPWVLGLGPLSIEVARHADVYRMTCCALDCRGAPLSAKSLPEAQAEALAWVMDRVEALRASLAAFSDGKKVVDSPVPHGVVTEVATKVVTEVATKVVTETDPFSTDESTVTVSDPSLSAIPSSPSAIPSSPSAIWRVSLDRASWRWVKGGSLEEAAERFARFLHARAAREGTILRWPLSVTVFHPADDLCETLDVQMAVRPRPVNGVMTYGPLFTAARVQETTP